MSVRIPDWSELKTRNVFSPPDKPELLFHYTDLNGANGIITSKSLWLTKIQYLNDTSELKYGIDLFKRKIQEISKGIKDAEKKEFLLNVSNNTAFSLDSNYCVASFCEDGDLLSQWRGYGKSVMGVALGFISEALRKARGVVMNLWKCVYEPDQQNEIIEDLINCYLTEFDRCSQNRGPDQNSWESYKAGLSNLFAGRLLTIAPAIKNNYFKEENEWRLVTIPVKHTSDRYNVQITNERVFQYYSLDFSMIGPGRVDFLHKIIIGPNREPELIRNALFVLLQRHNYININMDNSKIPFRA